MVWLVRLESLIIIHIWRWAFKKLAVNHNENECEQGHAHCFLFHPMVLCVSVDQIIGTHSSFSVAACDVTFL